MAIKEPRFSPESHPHLEGERTWAIPSAPRNMNSYHRPQGGKKTIHVIDSFYPFAI